MGKRTKTETGEQPTGKEIRLPSEGTMRSYNNALTEYLEAVDDAKENLTESTSSAVKAHLKTKPFKAVKALYDAFKRAKNQSIAAEKLAQFLAQFDEARKFFKLDELANLQGRMFGKGEIGGNPAEPPRETDEDGEPDPRPRHLRQPGASAAATVQQLAERSGAKRADEDNLKNVGRGDNSDTKH